MGRREKEKEGGTEEGRMIQSRGSPIQGIDYIAHKRAEEPNKNLVRTQGLVRAGSHYPCTEKGDGLKTTGNQGQLGQGNSEPK